MARHELKIFSGNANLPLAKEICRDLGLSLGDAVVGRFPDGEISFKINENVRGADVFVVQSTSHPVDEHLMELLLMVDAFRRSSARRITAVIPYFGYARQDRKDQPRVPVSAKLVANLITTAGADRVLTMDLHAPQLQGFFDIPLDHLIAEPVLVKYFAALKIPNLVVTSTDVGGATMARSFASHLGCSIAIVDKRRGGPSEVKAMGLVGDVQGANVLIPDDMITTAGTLSEAVHFLKSKGALKILACCTHGVFCGPALERLESAPLEEVVVTNTVQGQRSGLSKLKILSVANLFAEAIKSIHDETSVSRLFRVEGVNRGNHHGAATGGKIRQTAKV